MNNASVEMTFMEANKHLFMLPPTPYLVYFNPVQVKYYDPAPIVPLL